MIVSEITQVLNKDAEMVYCLTGYSNGKEISAELLPDASNLPKQGDIIQYTLNPNQKIKKFNVLCDYETEDFEENTFLDDISYSKCNTINSVNDGKRLYIIGTPECD